LPSPLVEQRKKTMIFSMPRPFRKGPWPPKTSSNHATVGRKGDKKVLPSNKQTELVPSFYNSTYKDDCSNLRALRD
jgi:hypothetical protein